MTDCILCKSPIRIKAKPEHILLNALGGRATVRMIICPACNEKMGGGPDRDLVESVKFLSPIAGLKNGDGKAAPAVTQLSSEGLNFNLLHGGQVKVLNIKRKLNFVNGGYEVEIEAFDEQVADQLLRGVVAQIAKSANQSKDEKFTQRICNDLSKGRQTAFIKAPSLHQQIPFGEGKSQQAMAKACFVLWGKHVGNDECLSSRYDPARQYIWTGLDTNLSCVDLRPLPEMKQSFGPNPNLVWAGSDNKGQVFGYFRLLGAIGWRFSLGQTERYIGRQILLISNPFRNENWNIYTTRKEVLDPSWVFEEFETSASDFGAFQAAMQTFLSNAKRRAMDVEFSALAKRAVQQSGFKDGDVFNEKYLDSIVNYVRAYLETCFAKREERFRDK